jgi:hypothetical protein
VGDPIEPRTYGVFILVLACTALAGALRPPRPPRAVLEPHGFAPELSAVLVVLILLYVLATSGWQVLFVPKGDQTIGTASYVGWRVMASLATLYGVIARKRGVLLCGLVGLLLMFVASDRTAVAMAAAAAGVAVVGRRGRLPPLRAARAFILPGVVALVLVWGGKLMHVAIRESFRRQDTAIVTELLQNPVALRYVTTRSEPFLTQAILNQAIRRDWYIGPKHLVGVLYQPWPAPSMFGHPSNEFNTIFQARLFPTARKNTLAYNFWAEAMVSGGWLLLAIYIALYLVGIEAANAAARSTRLQWRGVGLLMGAYWTVYIQRNSLASILAYEKQVFILGLLLIGAAALIPVGRRVRAAAAPRAPVPAPPAAA